MHRDDLPFTWGVLLMSIALCPFVLVLSSRYREEKNISLSVAAAKRFKYPPRLIIGLSLHSEGPYMSTS